MQMKCKVCGEERDCRIGVCWYCAEAESVINNGTDMYDKKVATTPMEKLKWLIAHSWNTRN